MRSKPIFSLLLCNICLTCSRWESIRHFFEAPASFFVLIQREFKAALGVKFTVFFKQHHIVTCWHKRTIAAPNVGSDWFLCERHRSPHLLDYRRAKSPGCLDISSGRGRMNMRVGPFMKVCFSCRGVPSERCCRR